VPVLLGVRRAVAEAEGVAEPESKGEAPRADVAETAAALGDKVGVGVAEGVVVGVPLALLVPLPVPLGVGMPVVLALALALRERLPVREGLAPQARLPAALPDMVLLAVAVAHGVDVVGAQPDAIWETLGVNSKAQLAELERIHQQEQAQALLEAGVGLADPSRIDIRGTLSAGRDCFIDVNCVFEGTVVLGDRVRVGANCVLRDARIESGTENLPMCHIDQAQVGAGTRIGPFARLRPGTVLGEDNHVGNFVEMKNTKMAAHSKANHLAYVGDAIVGARVNIGAGTITCNYDGVNKHQTVIEDDAFIGSDTQLVAPVTVGRGATLGAGTTLTRNAPPDQLTVSRAKQVSVPSWQRPVKHKPASKE